MYSDPDIVARFVDLEENEMHKAVSDILDRVAFYCLHEMDSPIRMADLGAGAHIDRYDRLFLKLKEVGGSIDWVDSSPYMLDYAKKVLEEKRYKARKSFVSFIQLDIQEYLQNLSDRSLNLVLMKYTLDHIHNVSSLFSLFYSKLRKGGVCIATLAQIQNPERPQSGVVLYLWKEK